MIFRKRALDATAASDGLTRQAELRPLSVDDVSTVRYVHSTSFIDAAGNHYTTADIDAFHQYVQSPHYADVLLGNRAIAAWIGSQIVGSAAWSPRDTPGPTARILAVYVQPLFSHAGIGRLLVQRIEAEAHAEGYPALNVSATLNAVGFFEALGYWVTRNGNWPLPSGREIPVAFMRKVDFAYTTH